MGKKITLVPIGMVPQELLTWLAGQLSSLFGCGVVTGATIPRPGEGYDMGRQQYDGGSILAALGRLRYPRTWRLVGLIDEDCYAAGLNFIFGEALINGALCFVALPRLRPSFYGLPDEPALFHERALKEVVHELGHTQGLPHCPDPRCVMHFSNTLHDTDRKSSQFCGKCRR